MCEGHCRKEAGSTWNKPAKKKKRKQCSRPSKKKKNGAWIKKKSVTSRLKPALHSTKRNKWSTFLFAIARLNARWWENVTARTDKGNTRTAASNTINGGLSYVTLITPSGGTASTSRNNETAFSIINEDSGFKSIGVFWNVHIIMEHWSNERRWLKHLCFVCCCRAW